MALFLLGLLIVVGSALGSGFLYAGNELRHGRGTPSGTVQE